MKVWIAVLGDDIGDKYGGCFVAGAFSTRELAVEMALSKEALGHLAGTDPCGPWVQKGSNHWRRPGGWASVSEYDLDAGLVPS